MALDIASSSTSRGAQASGTRRPATTVWARLRQRRYLVLAVLVALLAAIGWYVAAGGEDADAGFTTAQVARGNIEDTVTAVGNLQPRDYVDVGAQVSGQLKKLYVDIGDHVKEGQLLAEIDARVQTAKVASDQAQLANLKAQLADKQAQASLAAADFQRQKRLMAADATSKSAYDSAAQAAKSATAGIASIKAQIDAANSSLSGDEVTLGYAKIYSPMTGTVASITSKQGTTLNANQSAPIILRIADLSTMTVYTQVSEADVSKLRVGMPAYFTTLGDPNKRWTGKLTQIQPTPDVVNNVVLYTATFDVQNPDEQLMTQMTAQVFFVVAQAKDAVTVPVAALHQARAATRDDGKDAGGAGRRARRHGPRNAQMQADFSAVRAALKDHPDARRYWVRVVEPDGTTVRRPVAIGVSNRVSAEVLAGLKVGDTVVVGRKQSGSAEADNSDSRRRRHFGGPRL